jgi:ATP-dependent RNA helicase DeaD
VIYKKLEWLSREDLIKKFVSLEFNRFLDYYKHAGDINVKAEQRESRDSRQSGGSRDRGTEGRRERTESVPFTRLYINAGLKNGLTPPRLIGLINDYGRSRKVRIGKIDIQRNFSFFEVEAPASSKIISGFRGANFEGLPLEVNFAELSKPKGGNREYSDSRPAGKPQRRPKTAKPEANGGKKPTNDKPFWEQFLESEGDTGRKKGKKKQK